MQLEQIDLITKWLCKADGLLITAGAGMGVDSGLPDFRGNEGFWKAYPALGKSKLSFAEMADPSWFDKNPRLAWGFYGHRLNLYRQTTPHLGFSILQKWAKKMIHGVAVFTSNVDGQFQISGFPDASVYECHGSIHYLQCSTSCTDAIWSADFFIPDVDTDKCLLLNELPLCPHCGSVARPNILMFSDSSWLPDRCEVQGTELKSFLSRVENPLVIELGAGTVVPSVRQFGEQVSNELVTNFVRLNLRESSVFSANSIGLGVGALDGLNLIDQRLNQLNITSF
jgi:NAD-dependent SIR2 family protein deacetylase